MLDLTGEGKETCSETRVEMVNIGKSSLDWDQILILTLILILILTQISFEQHSSSRDWSTFLFWGARGRGVEMAELGGEERELECNRLFSTIDKYRRDQKVQPPIVSLDRLITLDDTPTR